MARGVRVAAGVVGLHTAANLGQGVPHAAVPVELATGQRAFVIAVVLLASPVALGLLWRDAFRTTAVLVAVVDAVGVVAGVRIRIQVNASSST